MTTKLTWEDLIISDLTTFDWKKSLAFWDFLITGRVSPVFLSKFGDWFLRRPDGKTEELCVLEGTVQTLANTPEEFLAMANDPTWQEEYLLSYQVSLLHERGLVPARGECYGLVPHPALSGKLEIEGALAMKIAAWQLVCAKMYS